MSMATGPVRPPGAVELLERAIAYTGAELVVERDEHLDRSTPCAQWDLLALLRHMDDSLDALAVAASAPALSLVPSPSALEGMALVDRIRWRACTLLGHWHPEPVGSVGLGALALPRELLGAVGALEITLHGWDVSQATGSRRPIPPALAMDLWPVARDHVTDLDRPVRFGPEVNVPDTASPQTRLLAHTGRR
jgi:uncharacterized protein (TIGR03086 family)